MCTLHTYFINGKVNTRHDSYVDPGITTNGDLSFEQQQIKISKMVATLQSSALRLTSSSKCSTADETQKL
jgi:hypothetical protein